MTTAHTIYESAIRQLNGVLAERDALMDVITAKQAQVDALLTEREALRAHIEELRAIADKWRRLYVEVQASPGEVIFEVSAVTEDGAE
jgi:cell division protein FtsB